MNTTTHQEESMTIKTPEQIAEQTVESFEPDDRMIVNPFNLSYTFGYPLLKEMIVSAIEADRAQPERYGTVHAAVIAALKDRGNAAAAEWVKEEPDDFWERFAGPMLDEIERAARHECDYCDTPATGKNEDGESVCDEHMPETVAPEDQCDECDERATNRWPDLKEPVKLCDSCEHNARRSGWEPGQ